MPRTETNFASKQAKLLKHADKATRAAAAEALGKLGETAAPHAKALSILVHDEDIDVQLNAVDALSMLGQAAAPYTTSIAHLLGNDSSVLRAAAVQALGNLGGIAMPHFDAMAKLLTDENQHVAYFALEVFRDLGFKDVAPNAVTVADQFLESDNWKFRRAAVEALGNSGDAALGSIDRIAKMLNDEHAAVRSAAVIALSNFEGHARQHVTAMTSLLNDSDGTVRRASVDALRDCSTLDIAGLVKQFAEGDPEFRSTMADNLVAFGHIAKPHVCELFAHPERDVVHLAIWVLYKLGEVQSLLSHESGDVRCVTLEMLADAYVNEAPRREILDAMASSLCDQESAVRSSAAAALGSLGAPAVTVVLPLLRHSTVEVRSAALTALGQMQVAASPHVGDMADLLWDDDLTVRLDASKALSRIGDYGTPYLVAAQTPCLDVEGAKSFERPLLKMAAEMLGWKTSRSGVCVAWVQGKENVIQKLHTLRKGDFLSHIPCLGVLTQKVPLAEALDAIGATFWPKTWCVPEVSNDSTWTGIRRGRNICGQSIESVCQEAFSGKPMTLIVKPNAGSQGKDISLAQCAKELRETVASLPKPAAIIQEYVEQPLLLDGFKWDARVYALIVSGPLGQARKNFACYLARDGLVRLCVDRYESPKSRNLHRITSHLTNYSLSKISDKFVHTDDPDNACYGNKRRLAAVLEHLESGSRGDRQVSAEQIWHQLGNIVRTSVDAITEMIQNVSFDPEYWEGNKNLVDVIRSKYEQYFHIIGLDVIIDHTGKPWLLEINSAPSLDISETVPVADGSGLSTNGSSTSLAGDDAIDPEPPSPGSPSSPVSLIRQLRARSQAQKVCRCGALVKSHVHRNSPVDVAVKLPVLEGAFRIVDAARNFPGSDHRTWTRGTLYQAV